MSSVRHRIYVLLGLSASSPHSEYRAAERLRLLEVHGRPCKRCRGTGHYTGARVRDSRCFNCGGRGTSGIAFNDRTLAQLEAMEASGELTRRVQHWLIGDMLRETRETLTAQYRATGIDGLYVQHRADEAPVGDWNRDLHDIHQTMRSALALIEDFPAPEAFDLMAPSQQVEACERYKRRVAAARERIRQAVAALDAYQRRHPKPDFRAECLSLMGLTPRRPADTARP